MWFERVSLEHGTFNGIPSIVLTIGGIDAEVWHALHDRPFRQQLGMQLSGIRFHVLTEQSVQAKEKKVNHGQRNEPVAV